MAAVSFSAHLGVDFGGTSVKAGLFDAAGKLLGFGSVPYCPVPAEPGFAELPLDEFVASARAAVRTACSQFAGIIRTLTVVSQGQTFTALDAHDRPLFPAILWYDSRGASFCEKLSRAFRECGSDISSVAPIATVAKIAWLQEKFPEKIRAARRFLRGGAGCLQFAACAVRRSRPAWICNWAGFAGARVRVGT